MKLSEIYKIADSIAPKALSDEYCARYGAYDNSGILVDTGEEIEKILFALDLTDAVIQETLRVGAKLIVTHHPAIYSKISCICVEDSLGEKLTNCIKNGISVLSMHLNLDCAVDGIDESLMKAVKQSTNTERVEALAVMHPLSDGGYGRVYEVQSTVAGTLATELQKQLSTKKTVVYNDKKSIQRIASFCGSGCDEEGIAFALEHGADAVISSDFKHHIILSALEKGLSVIALTHYASENYGFKKYYEKISRLVKIPCSFYEDERLL